MINKDDTDNEPLQLCVDRSLTTEQEAVARLEAERDDQGGEATPEFFKAGVLKWKLWKPKQLLCVGFMGGDAKVRDRVFAKAKEWEKVVSLRFERVSDPKTAHIRISFDMNDGSWSYVGREALGIPKDQPTMNYGWLYPDTSEVEYSRTVLHEFGHAIGCVHEHQTPPAGIAWNEAKVYEYFMGPPNNWTKSQVKSNILDRYGKLAVNSTAFDRLSIMIYAIPKKFLLHGEGFPSNSSLSETDKQFMRSIYP